MDNEYLQEQKKKREKLFGYIFLAWFICSFIGFFIIDDDNYMIMNLGQYFLVFGLMVIFKAKKYEKLIAIPLALIGLSCIIIPYFMMHPELVPSGVDLDDVIVLLILCGFLITGLCAAAVPILKRKHLKEICTDEVQATVVDYAVSTSRKGNTLRLSEDKTCVPDVVCCLSNSMEYYEVECGNHHQSDFNDKCDKLKSITQNLFFVAPNKETVEKKLKPQIEAWINARGRSQLKLSGVVVYLTSISELAAQRWTYVFNMQSDKPIYTASSAPKQINK